MGRSNDHVSLSVLLWLGLGRMPLALWTGGNRNIPDGNRHAKLRNNSQIAPLRYLHIGSAAGLLGVWIFTFLTVFAGGIALDTVGARIWIWPLVFNFAAILFVYFMCPDVS